MPLDLYVAEDTKGTNRKGVDVPNNIDPNLEAFDGGDKTKERNHKVITNSKCIVWNGPQGFIENPIFRNASYGVLDAMIEATKTGALTIAGGGETGATIMTRPGSDKLLYHVSTGGGATLELLEGKVLPGVDFLTNIEDLAKIKSI
jgi:phosphoglycerate kinase